MKAALWTRLSLVAAATACGADLVGPDRGDPARFGFANAVSFACGRWNPEPPAVSLGLFDVHFGPQLPGPTDEQVRILVRRGGTVVHRYHVNAVRVIMSPAAVEQLDAPLVRGVVEPAGFPVSVGVGFHDVAAPLLITGLGGQVTWVSSRPPHALIGVVPDTGIPALRRDARVRYVEWSGIGCFTD